MDRNGDAVIQNLRDAGCNAEFIREFISLMDMGRKEEGIRILEQHRHCLLESLHKEQKRIDCLDYLIYRLNKE